VTVDGELVCSGEFSYVLRKAEQSAPVAKPVTDILGRPYDPYSRYGQYTA
jgi:hypothetical protein